MVIVIIMACWKPAATHEAMRSTKSPLLPVIQFLKLDWMMTCCWNCESWSSAYWRCVGTFYFDLVTEIKIVALV